jgi:hypothetical protein
MMQGGSSGSNFHKLLGRGLTDQDFRARLMDPQQQAGALQEMGIEPDETLIAELNNAIQSLNNLAMSESLGGDINAVA